MRAIVARAAAVWLLLAPFLAHAYSCPVLIKEADDLIAKAEAAVAKGGGDRAAAGRALAEAKKMVGEARHDHETATSKAGHAAAVRKAKIAKAYAEEAQVLAER
jgi:hypothetical protein